MPKPLKIRKGCKYPASDIMGLADDFTSSKYRKVMLDGDLVTLNSTKMKTFQRSGLRCVCCGLVGTYFVKEKCRKKLNDQFHLSLYGSDFWGYEVELTSDHVKPQSRGGSNGLHNRQTLCATCNSIKGNKEISNKNLYERVRRLAPKRRRRRAEKTRRALVSQGAQGICQSF